MRSGLPTREQVLWTVALVILLVALAVFIYLGYYYEWRWTGFSRKRLFDWIQVLVIPVAVAVGTFVLNQAAKSRDEATQRAQREREEAIENQQAMDVALDTYFDKMEVHLTQDPLRQLLEVRLPQMEADGMEPALYREEATALILIRTRTLTLLERLDAKRKRAVMQFLSETGLIDMRRRGSHGDSQSLLSLRHANFSGADLAYMSLTGKALQGVDFRGAILSHTDLLGSDLSEANLQDADLIDIRVSTAREVVALPEGGGKAAPLNEVNLTSADLSGANLRGATGFAEGQLEQQAASLKDTTMPDGSVHD